jgi:predicted dehydrogenase
MIGTKGALVINDLDPQEALLRAGKFPENGTWTLPTSSQAFIHRGEVVEEIESIPGNYAHFYKAVELAITKGSPWPIPNSDALLVAALIDQAREVGTRAF